MAFKPDGVILFDRDWRYCHISSEETHLFRIPRAEALGRTLWEVFPDVVGTETERELREVAASGRPSLRRGVYAGQPFVTLDSPTPEGGLLQRFAFFDSVAEPPPPHDHKESFSILVADTQLAHRHLAEAFPRQASPLWAAYYGDAIRLLERNVPDVIVCGVHFDDSRMFDVLAYANDRLPQVPFLCVQVLGQEVPTASRRGVALAAESFGAGVVEFQRLVARVGTGSARLTLASEILARVPSYSLRTAAILATPTSYDIRPSN